MHRTVLNPFASILASSTHNDVEQKQESEYNENEKPNIAKIKVKDHRQGVVQPLKQQNAKLSEEKTFPNTSLRDVKTKENVTDELTSLASKISELSDISAESIMAFVERSTSPDEEMTPLSPPVAPSAPRPDRFSVGVGMGRKNRSRLSSAGRASLDMRDFDLEEVKRHRLSILSRSPAPPASDDIPAVSSTKKGVKEKVNFLEFCSIGVDREVLSGKAQPDWNSCRQKPQVLDCYPAPTPLIENIMDYCFPKGVSLDLLTQQEVESYSHSHHDRLHVLSFQDAKGVPTYATVLTVVEIIPSSFTLPAKEVLEADLSPDKENGTLVAYLLMLEKRRRAVGVILRFFAKRSKILPKNIFEEVSKPKSRMGEVVKEAMTAEKEKRQGNGSRWVKSPPPRYANSSSIYNGVTMVKMDQGQDLNLCLEQNAEQKAPSTPQRGQEKSMMSRLTSWSSMRAGFNLTNNSGSNGNNNGTENNNNNRDTGDKIEESRVLENVSGLYEFFSDEEDNSSVTGTDADDLSILSSPRSRARTESSVAEAETSAAPVVGVGVYDQSNEPQYYIATEKAYCLLHEKSHHSVAAKMIIAIASKESLSACLSHGTTQLSQAASLHRGHIELRDKMVVTSRFLAKNGVLRGDEPHFIPTADITDIEAGEQEQERDRTASTMSTLSTCSDITTSGANGMTLHKDKLLLCDVLYQARTRKRRGFISYMQNFPLTSKSAPNYGTTSLRQYQQRGSVKVSYSAYSSLCFRLPAIPDRILPSDPDAAHPSIASIMKYRDELWMEATMFAILPAEVVVQVLKILLMERSLIVYSSVAGLVTSITTALVSLLAPFTWAGAFVPLLPLNCKEIMQAPVPFLVGTTSIPNILTDVSPQASVLHVDDYFHVQSNTVKRRKRHLLMPNVKANTLNKNNNSNSSGEEGPGDSLGDTLDVAAVSDPSLSSGGQALCSQVRRAASILRVHQHEQDGERGREKGGRLSLRAASLQMMTFCMSMTAEEQMAVHRLRRIMMGFTREILGDLVSSSECIYNHPSLSLSPPNSGSTIDGSGSGSLDLPDERQEGYCWAKYGVMGDGHEHDFIFFPEWFLDQHRQSLRFLSAACTSQYFLSYVDSLRLFQLHRSRCREFLSTWMWFKWSKRSRQMGAKTTTQGEDS